MTELKPCPFCGGKARIRKINKYHTYAVRCVECGATSASFGMCEWHDTPFIAQAKAKDAWNRRTHENR